MLEMKGTQGSMGPDTDAGAGSDAGAGIDTGAGTDTDTGSGADETTTVGGLSELSVASKRAGPGCSRGTGAAAGAEAAAAAAAAGGTEAGADALPRMALKASTNMSRCLREGASRGSANTAFAGESPKVELSTPLPLSSLLPSLPQVQWPKVVRTERGAAPLSSTNSGFTPTLASAAFDEADLTDADSAA